MTVLPGDETAVAVPPWSAEDATQVDRMRTTRLELSGFTDLDFLPDFARIEELRVVDLRLKSDRGATNIRALRRLHLETYAKNGLDFTHLQRLEKLAFNWRAGAESVASRNSLRSLRIGAWEHPDLAELSELGGLLAIRLSSSNRLTSLRGLESFRELRVASLRGCTALEDIGSVAPLGSTLLELEVELCRRVNDISSIAGLSRLKRLTLVDCGRIPSLNVVAAMPALQEIYLHGTTVVEDGDMSPLLSLPSLRHVSFASRRHYSHKVDEIERIRKLKESAPHLPRWDW